MKILNLFYSIQSIKKLAPRLPTNPTFEKNFKLKTTFTEINEKFFKTCLVH